MTGHAGANPGTGADAGTGAVQAPTAVGHRGAVVGPHHLATAAGLAILDRGGHAVDAAIATNAVLGVVMAHECGVGGDAFWLIWDEAAGSQVGLNGSGRAPSGASPEALRDGPDGRAMPLRGPHSVTIPAAVRSWAEAHRRFGRLPVGDVLEPAIRAARDGFAVGAGFAAAVEEVRPQLATLGRAAQGAFEAVFRPAGRPWREHELVRLPSLAATLERLARDGFDAFYDGPLGDRQARFLADVGVPCAPSDVRGVTADWTVPLESTYRGIRLTTHPPNSSGIVALEVLRILEQFEVAGGSGPSEAAWAHLAIEAAKAAMADRDAFLGDVDSGPVSVGRLLDPARAATLAAAIDPDRASVPAPSTTPPGGGTVFVGVVDAAGNAVALIESNYKSFGSLLVDPETGVLYHDRGSYFSLRPGHPNVLAPGKRPLHTLLPAMLFREGERRPWIVVGSMGGDAQPQIHAQFVSAVVDGGASVEAAIAAPRWFVAPRFHFDPPRQVLAEPRFAPGFLEELQRLGHPVTPTAPLDDRLGHEHAIELVDGGPAAGGSVRAATDPRSDGLPAVR